MRLCWWRCLGQAKVLIVVPIRWPLVLTVGAAATCGGAGGAGGAARSTGLSATVLTGSGWRAGGVAWTAAVLEATELTAMMYSHRL
jgi:hypothetical protein